MTAEGSHPTQLQVPHLHGLIAASRGEVFPIGTKGHRVYLFVLGGLNGPRGVTLDLVGGQMYWADHESREIRRANLDGTGLTTLVQGLIGADAVTLDRAGGKMYWTDQGGGNIGRDIRRANPDGSGQEPLIANLNALATIALDMG